MQDQFEDGVHGIRRAGRRLLSWATVRAISTFEYSAAARRPLRPHHNRSNGSGASNHRNSEFRKRIMGFVASRVWHFNHERMRMIGTNPVNSSGTDVTASRRTLLRRPAIPCRRGLRAELWEMVSRRRPVRS